MKAANNTARKVPERRCLGCNGTFPKKDLIRVVRSPEGELSIDFTGKKSGRGAYLCADLTCFNKARRYNRISKNLGVQISDELYDSLAHEIEVSQKLKEMED